MHTIMNKLLPGCILPLLLAGTLLAQTTAPVRPLDDRYSRPNDLFNDPVWKERFIGSYGFLSGREPKIDADERDLFTQVQPLLPNNLQQAALMVESYIQQAEAPSPALYFALGNFHFQMENRSRARFYYQEALRGFPDFLRAHKNMGILYLQDDNIPNATKHLAQAVQLGDSDGRTFGLLGVCYQIQQKFVSAEASFRRAMVDDPDNDDWLKGLANALLQQEKYEEANALFAEMIAQDPNDGQLWLHQTNTYLGLGQMEKAATNIEIVRRMNKADAASLILLGNIYINQEDTGMALTAFEDAMDVRPAARVDEIVQATESLANYAAYDEAEELVTRIRSDYSSISDELEMRLLNVTSQIQIATGRGVEAAATLEKILERDPLNGPALLTLAHFYGQTGEVERAILMYERAADLPEFQVRALTRHGQLMVREKRYEDAIDLLSHAQSLEYKDSVADYLEQVQDVWNAVQASP